MGFWLMELLPDQYWIFCRDSKIFFLRIIFFVAKQTELKTIRKEYSLCSIFELHVYEVLKHNTIILILRKSHIAQTLKMV